MQNKTEKTDRRIGKTKQSIRDAFISLLFEKEITQITVKELSERANINRKTFYMYYANIHDILDKLENEIIERLLHILKDCDFFDKNFDVYAFFLSLNDVISGDLELYQRIVYSNSHTAIFTKAKEIIKASFLEKYDDSFPVSKDMFRLYTEYAASGIMSIYIEWFTMGSQIPLEELAKAAGDFTFYGFHSLVQ